MRVGDDGVFLTPKIIGMTDPETAALLWPYFGEVEARPRRLYSACWRTLVSAAYHVAGVGRGIPWVEDALGQGVTEEDRRHELGPLGDGFRTLEDGEREPIETRPTRYARKRREFDRRIRELETVDESNEAAHPSALPFYRRIEELGRSIGARVVFFTIRRGAGQSDAPGPGARRRDRELDRVRRPPALPRALHRGHDHRRRALQPRRVARLHALPGRRLRGAGEEPRAVIFTEYRFLLFFALVLALHWALRRTARASCSCSPRAGCSTRSGTGASCRCSWARPSATTWRPSASSAPRAGAGSARGSASRSSRTSGCSGSSSTSASSSHSRGRARAGSAVHAAPALSTAFCRSGISFYTFQSLAT